MGLFSASKLFGMTIRESATDGSDFTNPDADYRLLFLGEDGKLHVKDSAGAVTDIDSGAGSVATDAIWDAKGDIVGGTGSNTAARLAVAANGSSLRAASGATAGIEWQLNNLAASVAPAVTDDVDLGYTVGSRWADTTADKEYVCLDNTDGAAVWKETTQAAGGVERLLAYRVYQAGSDENDSTASTTLADLDASNLYVTFSGTGWNEVLVKVSCMLGVGDAAKWGELGLREGSTNVSQRKVLYYNHADGLQFRLMEVSFVVTGITDGNHTYKLAGAVAATSSITVYNGNTSGPVIFQVWGLA